MSYTRRTTLILYSHPITPEKIPAVTTLTPYWKRLEIRESMNMPQRLSLTMARALDTRLLAYPQ